MDEQWTDPEQRDYRLLGAFEVVAGEQPLRLGPPQQRAVLALLLLRAGAVVPAEALIDGLWPQRPPGSALNIVHGYVAAIRATLEPQRRRGEPAQVLESHPGGYRLVVDPDRVDVDRFTRLAGIARGTVDPADRADAARRALAEWRGEPLVGVPELPVVAAERVRLAGLRREVLELRIDADLALGRAAELVPELEGLVHHDPTAERLRSRLIRALYGAGRQADALAVFETGRRVLADELGVDPGPELAAVHQAVLRHDPALLRLPPPAAPPPSLPAPVGGFVGRRAELERLRELLRGARALTVTGPGGAGKTRLAIELARTVPASTTWFVDLSAADTPASVPAALATALDGGAAGRPADVLRDRLGQDEGTVVIDNAEHVLDACADLVVELLGACPRLRILTTSREALGIPGEEVWTIPALDDGDAAALFTARAGAALPRDEDAQQAVHRIVRRLDGLPLAVELAAAQVRALSVGELATRLERSLDLQLLTSRGTPPRHRTLATVIDWSYQLLTPELRDVFERLSVFGSGFGADAAGAVSGLDDIVPRIARLVAASLLQHGTGVGGRSRYRMLHSVRAFATDRLATRADAPLIRQRHLAHVVELAERLTPLALPPRDPDWLHRMEEERDELRGAATAALRDDPAAGVRIVAATALLWVLRGPVTLARELTTAALAHASAAPPRTRMRLLYGAATAALADGDLDAADAAGLACAELAQATCDDMGIGWGAGMLGLSAWARGDYREGQRHTEIAAAASERAGDTWSTAIQLTHLGRVASDRGDLAAAGALLERATRLARTSGQHQAVGFAFDQRAVLALRQGENARAATLAVQAATAYRAAGVHDGLGSALRTIAVAAGRTADLERSIAAHRERFDLHRRHGHRAALAGCLEDVAELAQRGGAAAAQVVRLLAAAAAVRTAHELSVAPPEQAHHERRTSELRAALGDRAFDDAWTDGVDRGPEGAVADAEHVLEVLGGPR